MAYSKKDATKETNTTHRQTSKAWHQAREDAQSSNHPIDKKLTSGWNRKPDKERN